MTFEDFLLEARPTRAAFIEAGGGSGKGRARLARRMANISLDGRLPAKGTAERRRYDAAIRALQRGEPGINPRTGRPKQVRSGRKITNRRIDEVIQQQRRAVREERRLSREGGRIIIRALVRISREVRERDFDVELSNAEWSQIIGSVQQGEVDDAVDELSQMILYAYELDNLSAEITDVRGGRIVPN